MEQALALYLASKSPRRQELLQQIGLSFELLDVDVDEKIKIGEAAQAFVQRMALEKAQAGWVHASRDQHLPVLGSDTVVVIDGHIFGKPRDFEHAADMLMQLSGRCHEVMTAVAMVLGSNYSVRLNCSQVCFRELSMAEVEAYWRSGEPSDKAGAYAIQGLGAQFIRHIQGSYSAVMGLPLYETAELLSQYGVELL